MKKLLSILILLLASNSYAINCTGKIINPLTDICWNCMFPISLGGVKVSSDRSDTKNPKNPVCACMKKVGAVQVPVPGISLGFWEPVRLVDITNTPFCMVNLGGMELKMGKGYDKGTMERQEEEGSHRKNAFYHTHYYLYPLIYWLELLTDIGCMEQGSFDLAYMSEFDPLYTDESLSVLMSGEVFLFSNFLAQASCVADCISANIKSPIDTMFWCAGCLGSMYPFTGYVDGASGGIQASSLLVVRILAKLHRLGLALETSTSSDKMNGPLCKKSFKLTIKKSQYNTQLLFPTTMNSGNSSCIPLGKSDFIWGNAKEKPTSAGDFGYLIWRKKNCCFL